MSKKYFIERIYIFNNYKNIAKNGLQKHNNINKQNILQLKQLIN